MLLVIPLFAGLRGVSIEGYPGWLLLVPGLFAQAGIAEEILFRGYLFHHIRKDRPFWRAALLALAPFAAVDMLFCLTMPWPVALAAVALAVAVKVIQFPGDQGSVFPFVWMAASAGLPWLVFLVRRPVQT